MLDIRDRERVHIAKDSAIVAPSWQEWLPIWVPDTVFAHDLVSEEKLSVSNDARCELRCGDEVATVDLFFVSWVDLAPHLGDSCAWLYLQTKHLLGHLHQKIIREDMPKTLWMLHSEFKWLSDFFTLMKWSN